MRRFRLLTSWFSLPLCVLALGFPGLLLEFPALVVVRAQAVTIVSVTPTQTGVGQTPRKIVLKGSGFPTDGRLLLNDVPVFARFRADGGRIATTFVPPEFFRVGGTVTVKIANSAGVVLATTRILVGSGNTIVVTAPDSLVVNVGQSIQLQARVVDRNGALVPGAVVSFQGDTPDKATVSPTGQVTGVASGAATVRLTSGDVTSLASLSVSSVTTVSSGITDDGDILVLGRTGFNRLLPNQQADEEVIFASNSRRQIIRRGTFSQGLSDFTGLTDAPGNTNGTLTDARYNGPLGLGTGDGSQSLFVADTVNQSIRRVNLGAGQVETVITAANLTGTTAWGPRGVVQVGGDLYITDAVNHVVWRAQIGNDQLQVTPFAGAIGQSGNINGVGAAARFNGPQEITVGQGNVLVVTDRVNRVARLVSIPDATVTTLGRVGGAARTAGGTIEPNQTGNVLFNDPFGTATDSQGNIYIADRDSVRVISPQGNTVLALTDLAQSGTFQRAVGIAISNNIAFVLDVGRGQVIRVGLAAPTVSSVNPTQVRVGEATDVTLIGTNFTPETQVRIGNQTLTPVTVEGASQVRVRIPAQQRTGTVPLTVATRGGTAQATLTVAEAPAVEALRVRFGDGTAAPGARANLAINLDVPAGPGSQPGIVTLDIPLDPTRFDLSGVTVAGGGLLPSVQYRPGDLTVTRLPNGIRILLISSVSPVTARVSTGSGTFCTLSLPILATAPTGPVTVNVSATPPFGTVFNRPIGEGGQPIPFTSTAGTVTISR